MARILFVTKGNLSGPSFSLLHILGTIQNQHEFVVLVTSQGPFKFKLQQKGFSVKELSVRYRTIPYLYRFLKQGKFTLIYLNGFSASTWRVLIAAKLSRIRIIWHIREILTIDERSSRRFRSRVQYADHLIAVSDACAKSIKALKIKTEVTIIHNGINLNDFQFDASMARKYIFQQVNLPENSFIIVTLGRIHWMKNQCDAVRAFAILSQRYSHVHLCILGDTNNDYLVQITNLIEKLGLQNRIHILGFRQDVFRFLCGADLNVHTSLAEAHPRVLLESLGARLPVVSYDVGGVKEALIDGETGYLVPVSDIEQLAQHIEKLINDPDLRYRFGQKGHQIAKDRFSAKQNAADVLRVINKVLYGEILS